MIATITAGSAVMPPWFSISSQPERHGNPRQSLVRLNRHIYRRKLLSGHRSAGVHAHHCCAQFGGEAHPFLDLGQVFRAIGSHPKILPTSIGMLIRRTPARSARV